MDGISKSQVSRFCAEIDERVGAFLTRLIEGDWPYVWLNATYVKARRDHHIASLAVIVCVNSDSRRDGALTPRLLKRTCATGASPPRRTGPQAHLAHGSPCPYLAQLSKTFVSPGGTVPGLRFEGSSR